MTREQARREAVKYVVDEVLRLGLIEQFAKLPRSRDI